jgi:L-malate glycosyltransferase
VTQVRELQGVQRPSPAVRELRKVLLALDSFPGPDGGSERQIWILAQELVKRGWTVGFLLLEDSVYLAKEMPDASRYVVGSRRLWSWAFWHGALRTIRRARAEGYSIAHLWFNDCAVALPIPLAMAGFKVVTSRRDLGFWYTHGKLALLRVNASLTSFVVCNASAVATSAAHAERVPLKRIRVISNGVFEAQTHGDPAATRAELGLGADAIVVCIVANLRPLKRVHDAIEALAQIPARSPDIHLVVVGETQISEAKPYFDNLTELVQVRGLADRVHFIGATSHPATVIEAADICLLCSESEGLSNALLEYQLAARPVVCTDVGGNTEVVEDEVTGLLVPPGRPDRIAQALARLAGDDRLRDRLGRAGKTSVARRFAVRRMVDEHENLYGTLFDTGLAVSKELRDASW